MEQIKIILVLLVSLVFGFGFWYVIFWFLTNESNLFYWSIWTKICYLLFSIMAASGTADGLSKNNIL